jgi:signal transduction histidine kinase
VFELTPVQTDVPSSWSRSMAERIRIMFFGNSGENNNGTEKAQANVRIIISLIFTFYLTFGMYVGFISDNSSYIVMVFFFTVLVVSFFIRLSVQLQPGVYPARRAIAMVNDYGFITATMIVGGEYTAPLFAIILWITVGYGMRYGSRYLAIGTGLALSSLMAMIALSSYWRDHPFLIGTFIFTAIIVPAYAHSLLGDTRRARDAAIAADLAKSRFLAQASHDLRQPIHAISLFTACLRDERLTPDQQEMVDSIDRSLNSVTRLFRSLLDISTLDSGKLQPIFETVAIGRLLQDIVDQNSQAAKWADVDIRVVPCRRYVRTDPDMVRTMVQNILTNALKYAPGKPVLIGCRKRGNSLSIWICDRGMGIPQSHLDKVFDEFYRVSMPGRDIEGIGLGLSIVKRVARLIEVSVSLRSIEGQGTMVTLDGFQIAAAPPIRLAPRSPQGMMLLDGLRVLLIEDSKEVLLATSTLLHKWGCTVQAESKAPTEIEPCDVILADFDLNAPATGVECIEMIWNRLGHQIPAIIMTGHDEGRVQEQIRDRDIPVLAKPLQPAELRAMLMAQKLKADAGA